VTTELRPNPLRDPQDRRLPRIAGPCVLVIFGVTGDLSTKKLMPAVYDLANRGLLPRASPLSGLPDGIGRARTSHTSYIPPSKSTPVLHLEKRSGSSSPKASGLCQVRSVMTNHSAS
jgi:hypothetical protein